MGRIDKVPGDGPAGLRAGLSDAVLAVPVLSASDAQRKGGGLEGGPAATKHDGDHARLERHGFAGPGDRLANRDNPEFGAGDGDLLREGTIFGHHHVLDVHKGLREEGAGKAALRGLLRERRIEFAVRPSLGGEVLARILGDARDRAGPVLQRRERAEQIGTDPFVHSVPGEGMKIG